MLSAMLAPKITGSCGTTAMRAQGPPARPTDIDAVERDSPSRSDRKIASRSWKTVDLPAPDGPTRATTSPGRDAEDHFFQHALSGRVG